jgi:O-methyltransferase
MKSAAFKLAKSFINRFGFDIVKSNFLNSKISYPLDFDAVAVDIIQSVLPYTQTSPERIYALCEAVRYLVTNQIPGDFVECGVWRGGSMMAVALTLLSLNDQSRKLYLYDTFDGMTEPSDYDISITGDSAKKMLISSSKAQDDSIWCFAGIEDVKKAVLGTKYNPNNIHFIQGKVEDTIPSNSPSSIALLRLDTDWYESTYHELVHLYPSLISGGVIIIDDYGHWQGARKAVDEYLSKHNIKLLLNRVDYTGRIGVVS